MFLNGIKVGLDIGGHSVKCAVFDSKKRMVKGLWEAPISLVKHSINDVMSEEGCYERVAVLIRSGQLGSFIGKNKIYTAIQRCGTVSRYLELPSFTKGYTDSETRMALLSQASKLIPFPIDDVVLSYFKVPAILPDNKNNTFFFVAVQKDLLRRQTELLNKLDMYALELYALFYKLFLFTAKSLLDCCHFASRWRHLEKGRFTAIVHSGFNITTVLVVRDGYPYFVKEFSLAGKDFTYLFQMYQQSSWQDAEQSKIEYDTLDCKSFVEPGIVKWLNEIKNALFYFTKELSGSIKVEQIFLSGGTAQWKHLDERVGKYLEIPVKVNGFYNLRCEKNDLHCNNWLKCKVAAGLVLDR